MRAGSKEDAHLLKIIRIAVTPIGKTCGMIQTFARCDQFPSVITGQFFVIIIFGYWFRQISVKRFIKIYHTLLC